MSSKNHFHATEDHTFYWPIMTADDIIKYVGGRTQTWQAKWAVFKILGFDCKRFLPFSAPLPRSFACAFFARWTARKRLLSRLKNEPQNVLTFLEALPIWLPIRSSLKYVVYSSWKVLEICPRASKQWTHRWAIFLENNSSMTSQLSLNIGVFRTD